VSHAARIWGSGDDSGKVGRRVGVEVVMAIGIYRYKDRFHRRGKLEGLFLADDEDVAEIRDVQIVVSEALGKHTEVELTLDETCLTLVSDDPAYVKMFSTLRLSSGMNPFDHWENENGFEPEAA
jgi:hypothetical protein